GFGPNPLSVKCSGVTVTSCGAFSNSASSRINSSRRGQSSRVARRMAIFSMRLVRFRLVAPFDPGGAPGKAAAEGGEDEVIAFVQFIFPIPEAEWNGRGGRVALSLD